MVLVGWPMSCQTLCNLLVLLPPPATDLGSKAAWERSLAEPWHPNQKCSKHERLCKTYFTRFQTTVSVFYSVNEFTQNLTCLFNLLVLKNVKHILVFDVIWGILTSPIPPPQSNPIQGSCSFRILWFFSMFIYPPTKHNNNALVFAGSLNHKILPRAENRVLNMQFFVSFIGWVCQFWKSKRVWSCDWGVYLVCVFSFSRFNPTWLHTTQDNLGAELVPTEIPKQIEPPVIGGDNLLLWLRTY